MCVALVALVGVVSSAPPAVADPAITVDPGSAPAGASVTVRGTGFLPGETVTVMFGGSTVGSATSDDAGNFTVNGALPGDIPPGSHPMDANGSGGSSATIAYEVLPPATTTAPPTTTAPAATTAPNAAVTTTPKATPRPVGGAESTQATEGSDDNGFPTWGWILIGVVVLLALLGGGYLLATRPVAKSGAFSDDQGNNWEYCETRGCRVQKKSFTDTTGRHVRVRAVPRKKGCANCSCVLFELATATSPGLKLLSEDGSWVDFNPRSEYSARCVKKV